MGRGFCTRPRIDTLPSERSAVLAGPIDLGFVAKLQQQFELLREQRVIVVEVETKEGKGLDERAATGDDLRAALGDQVEGCELLKDADRVGGAQHGDRAGKADALGKCCAGSEDDGRSRVKKFGPVMFADTKHV